MPIQSRGGNNNGPNTEQKKWRELLREQGSVISGCYSGKIEIHHPIGQTAQIKTVNGNVNIGHWFLNALSEQEHEWLGNDLGRLKAAIGASFNFNRSAWDIDSMIRIEVEKMLFFMQHAQLVCNGFALEVNVPGEVFELIMGYHK